MFEVLGKSIRGVFLAAATACSAVTFVGNWQIGHHVIQQDDVHPLVPATIGTAIAPYSTYVSWEQAHKTIKYDIGGDNVITSVARHTPDSWDTELKWTFAILGAPGSMIGNIGGSITGYMARDHEFRGSRPSL